MSASGQKRTSALPLITIPNHLLLKCRLSAVERPFLSADATGEHYPAAASEDCRRVATTLLLRAQGIAARADVALFYTRHLPVWTHWYSPRCRAFAPECAHDPRITCRGKPDGMVTSSSPRAISNAPRLPRAGPLTQSTPCGGDLPSSGSGKCIQARPRAVPVRSVPCATQEEGRLDA